MKEDHIRSFGFPRWGEYGRDKNAEPLRMCDYEGCDEVAGHPALKSPNSREKWYFCKPHAAEYNANWDYFQGMSDEEAQARMRENSNNSDAFASSSAFEWGGAVDHDGLTNRDHKAYDLLEMDAEAGADMLKKQYRRLAKAYHPDANPGDSQAAERFHQIQWAYDHLSKKFA